MRGKRHILFLVFWASFGLASCNVPAPTLEPIDQFTQAPLVKNVMAGAAVELWAGNAPGSLALVATSPPVSSGSTSIRVPLPNHFSPGQIVQARQRVGPFKIRKSSFSNLVVVENNYVTNRYDNERSGWNPNESVLTVANVRNRLGIICEHYEVGAAIRAQPLYVENVEIRKSGDHTVVGRHNVVFVATDSDQVWAFDADSCVHQSLWLDSSGNPSPRDLIDPHSNESVPAVICASASKKGVFSTPVIDRTTNTMYVVGAVQRKVVLAGGQTGIVQFFRLHAIDITTGEDIKTTVLDSSKVQFHTGTKPIDFIPDHQINRPALLLDRGVLYLAFGSCGDWFDYHGWVVAYDANLPESPNFLSQVGVFNTSPDETALGAGVWQAGLGLAADGDDTIYLITGNGNFSPQKGNYGDTVLHLRLPTSSTNKEMQVIDDSFTPFDWNTLYNPGDADFGSGGPVLLRSGNKRFLLAGGKPAKSYLINRDCINCRGNPLDPARCPSSGCTSDDTYSFPPSGQHLVAQTIAQPQGSVAGPTYYVGPNGTRIYFGANWSPISAFDFNANTLPPNPLLTTRTITPDSAGCTAPIPTVSSNEKAHGPGILWAVFHPRAVVTPPTPTTPNCDWQPGDPLTLTLHAYEADQVANNLLPLGRGLVIGEWPPKAEHSGNSFQVPTVIHGKVYCGTQNSLVVFGLKRRPFCSLVRDCGGAVIFHCSKERDFGVLELQRKQGNAWRNVTNSSSRRDLPDLVSLWDYPSAHRATYRICSKDDPLGCTPEFPITIPDLPCRVTSGLPCGRVGELPCSFNKPWPVSPGRKTGESNGRPSESQVNKK